VPEYPGESQTANQVAPVDILHGIGPAFPVQHGQFHAARWPGVFGTSGRNTLSGPSVFRLDLSLFKTSRLRPVQVGSACRELRPDQHAFIQQSARFHHQRSFGQVTGTLGSGSGVNGIGQFGRAFQLPQAELLVGLRHGHSPVLVCSLWHGHSCLCWFCSLARSVLPAKGQTNTGKDGLCHYFLSRSTSCRSCGSGFKRSAASKWVIASGIRPGMFDKAAPRL